ncbi:MAG: DUF3782 domain-containing protein [Prochlorothrix sp.]
MSDAVTLQDIYALFQRSQAEADRRAAEADRRAAEADRRAAEFTAQMAQSKAEADRRAAEADRRAAEADRRAAEADRRAADLDRRIADLAVQMDRSRAEADRRAVEAEKRLARAEAIAAQANQAVNALSSRWGAFVENLVAPAALRLFQDQGLAVQEVYQRVKSERGSENLEIDILVVNDTVAVAIEVKSRLTQRNLRQFLKNLDRFKTAFPHYADYDLYAAVAAIEMDGDVDRYAINQGLFLIQQSGESVKISNNQGFIPRAW